MAEQHINVTFAIPRKYVTIKSDDTYDDEEFYQYYSTTFRPHETLLSKFDTEQRLNFYQIGDRKITFLVHQKGFGRDRVIVSGNEQVRFIASICEESEKPMVYLSFNYPIVFLCRELNEEQTIACEKVLSGVEETLLDNSFMDGTKKRKIEE